ncbi:MAG TPA: hypothetical protein VFJ17_01730 [Mycobacteriales bacterium]|jgi:hypothetical protein|nr:hypothetical protein [Mycobacteriales bacterium]
MEYTSVLAGERFSDSPRCTDPVLAAVARAVNDYSSDRSRQRIAPYAGDLTTAHGAGDDVGRGIVRRCLLSALRYADGTRTHVLLVALLGVDRAAAGESRGWDHSMLSLDAELALLGREREVADAAAYVATLPVKAGEHARRASGIAVEIAVATIAESAGDRDAADDALFELFNECVDDYDRALAAAGQGSRLAWTADSTS